MVWNSLGQSGINWDKLDRASQLGTLLGELGAVPVCPVCRTLDSTGQLRAGLLMKGGGTERGVQGRHFRRCSLAGQVGRGQGGMAKGWAGMGLS